MGYLVMHNGSHTMRFSTKFLVVFLMACSLLVSGCAISPLPVSKPDSPQSTMAIIVLKNTDSKLKSALGVEVDAVTFENWQDTERFPKDATGHLWRSECFGQLERICIKFNTLPGRYHLGGFNGDNGTFYSLKGKVNYQKVNSFGQPWFIYDPGDFYFMLPRSEAYFVGSFLWSENADGALFKAGTFGLVPDKNGMSERAVLQELLQDKEFQKDFALWIPEVQERLAKLSQPAAVPAVAAPPASVKQAPAPKKKSISKK